MLKVVGASWKKIRLSTWIIGLVLVLGIIAIILGEMGTAEEDGNWAATVYWNKESGFEIAFWGQGKKIENIPKGVARAYYQPRVNTTGWAILDIETQTGYPDWVQAFGAGMLEGSLSWQMIHWQRLNTQHRICEDNEDLCDELKTYLEENVRWVKKMYSNISNPYWHQVRMFYLQLEGVTKGFEQGVKRSRVPDVDLMSFEDFVWLNAISDVEDLKYKFSDVDDYSNEIEPIHNSVLLKKLDYKRSIKSYALDQRNVIDLLKEAEEKSIRCGDDKLSLASAFIKLVPDHGKLFIAHNSAGPYSSMLKMLKHYQFAYRKSKNDRQPVPGKRITFSSYPGVIHSMDDFFIVQNEELEQKLVITGVPLPVFNRDLWKESKSAGQILIGPRIMAANRLASTGKEWTETLSKYNSGTGNKEWIVVDFKKFEKIAKIKEKYEDQFMSKLDEVRGLLWIADQIPGAFEKEDVTEILKSKTYWASYGLPFFKNISYLSGTDAMFESYGDVYSYNATPIAKIFRRDQENVTTMQSVANLMRSNFYKTDPLSYNNPRCAVGSRGDVESENQDPEAIGVTDTKIFSSRDVRSNLDLKQNSTTNSTTSAPIDNIFQIKAGPPYSDSWIGRNQTKSDLFANFDNINDIGPFNWPASEFIGIPHVGHPDVWNFEPIIIF